MIDLITNNYNYWISILLMMTGFYCVINSGNFVKKIMGLAIFQTSVLLFYISISYIEGAAAPILTEGVSLYHNPLPHVLMLTAIVVGVATMSVGLAIAIRIKEEYGTIQEDEILKMDETYKPKTSSSSAKPAIRRTAKKTTKAKPTAKKPAAKKAPAKKKASVKKKTPTKKATPAKKKPAAKKKAPAKKRTTKGAKK